jgi:crotonobetainyl-CoA hydratase
VSDKSYQYIHTERRGPIFIVTINRPEILNAQHPPAHPEKAEAWDRFAADPERWVGIVTGAGERAFCAGNDLKYQASGGDMTMPPSSFAGLTSRFDCFKPILAAVNGLALGGGFEIVLACDIAIAGENARMGLPEPRVGLAALAGGMQRLPRQVGIKNAMSMLLTGRQIDAAEAMRLGVVQEIAPPAKLMERTLAWAEQICECAPLSVRASKEVALGTLDRPLEEALKMRFEGVRRMVESEDFIEGPTAFAQERKPVWKGR